MLGIRDQPDDGRMDTLYVSRGAHHATDCVRALAAEWADREYRYCDIAPSFSSSLRTCLCVSFFFFLFVLRQAASRFVFAVAAVAAATCERWEIRAHVDQIGRQAYCSQRRRGFLGLEFSVHLACCEEGEPRPRMSARKFARRVAL